jgi:hypothetical protein
MFNGLQQPAASDSVLHDSHCALCHRAYGQMCTTRRGTCCGAMTAGDKTSVFPPTHMPDPGAILPLLLILAPLTQGPSAEPLQVINCFSQVALIVLVYQFCVMWVASICTSRPPDRPLAEHLPDTAPRADQPATRPGACRGHPTSSTRRSFKSLEASACGPYFLRLLRLHQPTCPSPPEAWSW